VRNPTWDPANDPLRLALPDRIEIQGGNSDDLWRQFSSGNLDTVFDETPPPTLVNRYLGDPSLRPQVHTLDTSSIVLADFNVSQPPFDDAAVRFAVAYALDRRSMVEPIKQTFGFGGSVIADHYASDPAEDSLAAGWSPFPGREGSPDLKAARAEMATSRYATGDRCAAPECSNVKVVVHGGLDPVVPSIARTFAGLGIHADIQVTDDFYGPHGCGSRGVAMCIGDGWFPDYPSAGNVLIAEFGSGVGLNLTKLGATPAQLAEHHAVARSVPSAQAEIDRCNQMVGQSLVECWTGLDQYVITQLMPAVPLAFAEVVRVVSPRVSTFAWDEGNAMPAIDRLSVAGS
jgi:ABC-type transport system substrate-binding protein